MKKEKRFFVIASFEKNIININKYIYIFTFAILSFQKMPLTKNRAQENVSHLENLSSQKSFFHNPFQTTCHSSKRFFYPRKDETSMAQ